MDEVIFVTHNKGKIASAQKQLKEVNFKVFEYDLEDTDTPNGANVFTGQNSALWHNVRDAY